MKRLLLVLFASSLFGFGFTQTNISETHNLNILCKVWGFLKYYHPKVAKGRYDWDQELIKKIPLIKAATTKNEINKILIDWINNLGKIKLCKSDNNNVPDSLKFNLDISWINDSTVFDKELIAKLTSIKENRAKHQYYIKEGLPPSFKREKEYKELVFPNEEYRLLGLFRYWNIINYFYPYKYKITQNWNDVLTEMIPKFQYPKDTVNYHLAMLELTAKINDSHSYFYTPYTKRYFGTKWAPFEFKIIDNKAVVTGFYDDSLSKINDVQYGDVILEANNQSIEYIITEKSKYIGASNKAAMLRNFYYAIFNSSSDSMQITFIRNNIIRTKQIKLYSTNQFTFNKSRDKNVVCQEIDENIGYINMETLKKEQVDSVMLIMMEKKAIIFDVRNYPEETKYPIMKYLNEDIKFFAKLTKPDLSYPGVIKWMPPHPCGTKNNTNYYKGKVVLLVNEETQSHAEFTCMALQTAPNATCIGSQTAGADGNMAFVNFPGGFKASFTGLGVYYPNGRETQRVGIIPDIEINVTIQGIIDRKDEVLEKAIEYIRTVIE